MRTSFATFAAIVLLLLIGCGGKEERPYIPLDQVPEAVMKVAKEKLPDVKFDTAWKTPKGNYEIRGKGKNGKTRDVQVTPEGKWVETD
jgi:hypothetical protein